VVSAAYAERGRPLRRGRAARWTAVAAAAACAAALVVAFTAPGEAVGDWLRGVVRTEAPEPAPTLQPLARHGRLLVVASTGPWIVGRGGESRRLGAYDDAAFSPAGLFAAVTRGRRLAAVDPRGQLRWSLSRPLAVTLPRWSPDGVRIAYATAGGTVVVRDADTGRRAWRRSLAGERVRRLAWSPGGRRLLAVTDAGVWVLDARGRVRDHVAMAAGTHAGAVAWLRDGRRYALVRTRTASEVVIARPGRERLRRVLAVPGRLTDLLLAPDGRALLAAAPGAGQWLLVPAAGHGRIAVVSGAARQFDPGTRAAARLPRVAGWVR
jgi:WD40 repeat protein